MIYLWNQERIASWIWQNSFFRILLKRVSSSDGTSFRLVSLVVVRHQEEREKAALSMLTAKWLMNVFGEILEKLERSATLCSSI